MKGKVLAALALAAAERDPSTTSAPWDEAA